MAPEQARGVRDIGPAADLYSLGAILYETLTGRPPFRGADVLETLAQVRDEEPVPPRRFQRQLPRDLETICLKCLQKEPSRRYASAAALADDLARFLAGEPIQARPVGVWERGLKWARRRPLGAALVVVSLAALVGLVVGALLIDEKRREADRHAAAAHEQEQKARASEEKARTNYERAERSYRLAHAAMDKLLGKLRADPRFQEGAWEELRKTLLQAELEFYTQFVEQHGDEPAFKAEQAQAYLRLAEVTRELDGGARAFAAARKAQALFTELARDYHDDVTYVAQRDKTQHLSALCNSECDPLAARQALLKESLAAVKVLAAAHPEDVDYLKQQAVILNSLAILESQDQNWQEAERLWNEALAVRQTLVDRFPDDPDLQFGLAKCYHNLGILSIRSIKSPRALAEARRLMQSLIEKYPHKASYRAFLALVDFNLGGPVARHRRPFESEAILREGLALAQPLVDRYPTVAGYRTTLAVLQVRLADQLWSRGKADAAFALYTEATKTIPPEQVHESAYARALEYLVRAHTGRATCLGRFGRHREAVWEWERALELEPYPDPIRLFGRACAMAQLGDHAEATRAADAVAKNRQDPFILYSAAKVYALSVAAAECGSPLAERYGARAVALLRQAIAEEDRQSALLARTVKVRWIMVDKDPPPAQRSGARAEPLPWHADAGGHRQFGTLVREGSLEPIRQRKDFQDLLRELRHQPAFPLKAAAPSTPASGNERPLRFFLMYDRDISGVVQQVQLQTRAHRHDQTGPKRHRCRS
jgi:tetratricopeptide (TPR) repeat protein